MKSEKAKEFINHITPNKANFVYCVEKGRLNGCIYTDICKVVELAEQEAEERMREKAVKAYCHDCCCAVVGECGIGSENCIALRDFIRKLDEK